MTDLTITAPEQVALEFITAHPIAVTVGADMCRTMRYWSWDGTRYRSITEEAVRAGFTRWLAAHYSNLRRAECKHIWDLIVQLRFIITPTEQWIAPATGPRDVIVTREGLVCGGEIRPLTPDYFAIFFESAKIKA